MNTCREDFEEYIAQNMGWSTARDTMGNYIRHEVQYSWIGWEACCKKNGLPLE